MEAFWIIVVGFLVAVNCGITGSFMVLRKMSMIGDAISHAVLPGIIIAYLIAGERDNFALLLGAALMGVFVTVMIEWFNDKGKLPADASIGLSFTFLFAVGIILVSKYTGQVDIDADCVLHGEIAYVPFYRTEWFGMDLGPKALIENLFVLGLILLFIALLYRPLVLSSFNEDYGKSLGVPVKTYNYILMSLVSLTTVFAFESVGAILVVAFLVIPPATAYIISKRLPQMLKITILLAFLSSIGGFYLAEYINGSIAGAMSVTAGVLFCLVLGGKQIYFRWLKSRNRIMPHRPFR